MFVVLAHARPPVDTRIGTYDIYSQHPTSATVTAFADKPTDTFEAAHILIQAVADAPATTRREVHDVVVLKNSDRAAELSFDRSTMEQAAEAIDLVDSVAGLEDQGLHLKALSVTRSQAELQFWIDNRHQIRHACHKAETAVRDFTDIEVGLALPGSNDIEC